MNDDCACTTFRRSDCRRRSEDCRSVGVVAAALCSSRPSVMAARIIAALVLAFTFAFVVLTFKGCAFVKRAAQEEPVCDKEAEACAMERAFCRNQSCFHIMQAAEKVAAEERRKESARRRRKP